MRRALGFFVSDAETGLMRQKASTCLACLLALALSGCDSTLSDAGRPAGTPAGGAPPNVLLLVVDGLGVQLGCYGHETPTPHIDRLARRGRRFDQAYCPHPDPGPSRTSLMNGRRPHEDGPRRGLQQRFRAGGYVTASFGAVYGESSDPELGWDVVEETSGLARDSAADPISSFLTRVLASQPRRPFFAAVRLEGPVGIQAQVPPHGSGAPSSTANDPEAQRGIPLIAVSNPGFLHRPGKVVWPAMEAAARRERAAAAHRGFVSAVDAKVGRLLRTLDRFELWPTTVVAVVGTSPTYLGQHGRLSRRDLLFEVSLRVPLIIASPRLPSPGLATPHLAELVDLHPTLLELSGLPVPEGQSGASLAPSLLDPDRSVRRAALSVVERSAGGIGRSVRTPRYRYNEWPDGSEELYDHSVDPRELRNLAGSAPLRPHVEGLRRRLDQPYGPSEGELALAVEGRESGARRNVLLMIFDDLNPRLGSYGYPVTTPHMDRLAQRGRLFGRAYAQVAMCGPSRMSMLTGWAPERLNMWHNFATPRLDGAVPLQEHFRANGYFTASVGKVYDSASESLTRWDELHKVSGDPSLIDDPRWWVPTQNEDEQEPDGQVARVVSALLEAHREGPFFIAAGFYKPHLRWVAPRRYFEMYPPEEVRLPAEPADDTADIPAIAIKTRPQRRPGLFLAGREPRGFRKDPRRRREAIAAYHACLSFVDAQVGVVLEALDRLGLWDSTIVVLTSDHGFHLGEHGGAWRKDTLFEEALRVPLLLAAPDLAPLGVAVEQPVELLDIYPTLVELSGLPRVPDLDGTSLVPLLDDPTRSLESAAFSFRRSRPPELARSIRTRRYRYTEWPDGSRELYDHYADPGERTNVARERGYSRVLARISPLLDEDARLRAER
jgi:iduronate 2-sulfatase